MSSALPEGWEIKSLGDMCKITTGRLDANAMVPDGKYRFYTCARNFYRINDFAFDTEALLVSGNGANVGYVHYYIGKFNAYQRTYVLDAFKENIFFMYQYLTERLAERIELEKNAGNTPYIVMGTLSEMTIQVPPLPEQEKIAAVLGAVDDVIEKTALQIKKLNDLKKSTMNELLTKGIGHTDFKPSKLGQIPTSWEVKTIGETSIVIEDGDRGSSYPKEQDFLPSGYCLFLSAKNVTKSGFKFDERVFISKLKHEQLRKGWVKRNDIVITTRGTVGNIAYFDNNISFAVMRINSGMALIRNTEPRIYTPFLYLFLSSELAKLQIDSLTFGSAQPQLTIGVINSLILPIPTFEEQKELVRIAGALKENYEKKQDKLSSLNALKKSLMQDLLSGKVRVRV
jgi:type I restriction enzyme, S subunit